MINPIEYEIMATMTPEHRPPMKWGKLGVFAKRALPFGSCLAMVISYVAWKSVGWAIFHGLLGWVYVAYYVFYYRA